MKRFVGRRFVPLLGIVALAATGCGDDGGANGSSSEGSLSSGPARFVRDTLDMQLAAKTKRDCKEAKAIVRRSSYRIVCPLPSKAARDGVRKIRLTAAATYGPAAVVDFTSPEARDGATIVLHRNPAGLWAFDAFGIVTEGAVGTDGSDSRDQTRDAVDSFLEAVSSRDCEAFDRHAFTQGVELKDVCRDEFPLTEPLARQLKANPGVSPRYLGGNANIAFYGLALPRPQPAFYIVSTVKTPEGSLEPFVVLNAQKGPSSLASGAQADLRSDDSWDQPRVLTTSSAVSHARRAVATP